MSTLLGSGGDPDVYTLEELKARVHFWLVYRPAGHWREQWLQGIEQHSLEKAPHPNLNNLQFKYLRVITYYGIPVMYYYRNCHVVFTVIPKHERWKYLK